jgi:ATP-binding cassette subfamily F protein 3
MLITHDRAFMDSVSTHVMGIHRQGIRKIAGSTHKLYQQILQEEEVYEKTRNNDDRKRRELEQFINRFRAQAARAKAVQSKIRALEKRKALSRLVEEKSLDFAFPSASFAGKWLMEVQNLGFSYGPYEPWWERLGHRRIFLIRDLTFSIGKRDRIGVIGKNGKGRRPSLACLPARFRPGKGPSVVRSTSRSTISVRQVSTVSIPTSRSRKRSCRPARI